MKLIKNFDQYLQAAQEILTTEKGITRVSTFNMFVREDGETEKLLELVPLDAKFLLGASYSSCEEGCPHCLVANKKRSDRYEKYANRYNLIIPKELHLKYFQRGNKAIVGGINISESGYSDMAIAVEGEEVKMMNRHFDTIYNKHKQDNYVFEIPEPVFMFGKYKGRTVKYVRQVNPDYINWIKQNLEKEKLISLGLLEN